jgi:hypothetical protein
MARMSALREGVVMGLIASTSVALFYAVIDLLAMRGAFYTVNILGRALFRELRHPAILMLPVPLDWQAIALYSALHLGLSLLIGVAVATLVAYAEEHPSHGPFVVLALVAGFVGTVIMVGLLSVPIRPVLPWWSIVVANSLSAALAGGYLLVRHPRIWRPLVPGPA